MIDKKHDLESYWNNTAEHIKRYRIKELLTKGIVGTLNPWFTYKKSRILKVLDRIEVKDKRVLEVGCGTGFNCRYLMKKGAKIIGVDISSKMIELAREAATYEGLNIPFYKIDGSHLSFQDGSFDLVFTVTVLQHILDEKMLDELLKSISRVTKKEGEAIIFEDVSVRAQKNSTYISRTRDDYITLFKSNDFKLASYYCISSPFYRLCVLPSRLANRIFRNEIKDEIREETFFTSLYLRLVVFACKRIDKMWQDEVGIGYFRFIRI